MARIIKNAEEEVDVDDMARKVQRAAAIISEKLIESEARTAMSRTLTT